MDVTFLSQPWMDRVEAKLNSDARYARVAGNWEGDMAISIQPGGPLKEPKILYFDLWHGKCPDARLVENLDNLNPAFVLTATYENIEKIVTGALDPMTALMIRKLQVKGNLSYMLRNVPVVLDFVRCVREITTDVTL